jgi:hypothetical protein
MIRELVPRLGNGSGELKSSRLQSCDTLSRSQGSSMAAWHSTGRRLGDDPDGARFAAASWLEVRVPIEVMKEVASTTSEITIAHGTTETSPVSFQSSRDDPLELRVSTVGRIHSTRRLAFGWELC